MLSLLCGMPSAAGTTWTTALPTLPTPSRPMGFDLALANPRSHPFFDLSLPKHLTRLHCMSDLTGFPCPCEAWGFGRHASLLQQVTHAHTHTHTHTHTSKHDGGAGWDQGVMDIGLPASISALKRCHQLPDHVCMSFLPLVNVNPEWGCGVSGTEFPSVGVQVLHGLGGYRVHRVFVGGAFASATSRLVRRLALRRLL